MQREKFIIDEILEDGQKIEINKSIADKRLTKLNLNNISLPPPLSTKELHQGSQVQVYCNEMGKKISFK